MYILFLRYIHLCIYHYFILVGIETIFVEEIRKEKMRLSHIAL